MSLLSRQDSLAYGSFLTSVDRTTGADDIDPSIAAQIDIAHGRDALAKATKDLMSIGSTAPAAHAARPATQARSVASTNAGGSTGMWPGFAPEQYSAAAAERHARPVNHIQSEQKRRANIRRGYEALCVAVPELREAIAREESSGVGRSGSTDGTEPGAKGKRRRKKADDSSGLDGRAGPRSENVVLQKTIDYIRELLSQHQDLLVRLQVARDTLLQQGNPPFPVPPQYLDANGVPLWNREWNGGTGINEDEEEEGGSEDDG